MLRVISGQKEEFFVILIYKLIKGGEVMGEITVTFGLLNNWLKPGHFVSFKVFPASRAGTKQLCNQGGFCYVPQCAAIKIMGTDGLKGIKRTSTWIPVCNSLTHWHRARFYIWWQQSTHVLYQPCGCHIQLTDLFQRRANKLLYFFIGYVVPFGYNRESQYGKSYNGVAAVDAWTQFKHPLLRHHCMISMNCLNFFFE